MIVSHNHPDHNADLENIDDLRYELYKRRENDERGGVLPFSLIWDGDTQSVAPSPLQNQAQHRFRPIVFDLGRCRPEDTLSHPNDLPFSLTYFEVQHGDLSNAVGFKVTLKDKLGVPFTLGYTGDTGFFLNLQRA